MWNGPDTFGRKRQPLLPRDECQPRYNSCTLDYNNIRVLNRNRKTIIAPAVFRSVFADRPKPTVFGYFCGLPKTDQNREETLFFSIGFLLPCLLHRPVKRLLIWICTKIPKKNTLGWRPLCLGENFEKPTGSLSESVDDQPWCQHMHTEYLGFSTIYYPVWVINRSISVRCRFDSTSKKNKS